MSRPISRNTIDAPLRHQEVARSPTEVSLITQRCANIDARLKLLHETIEGVRDRFTSVLSDAEQCDAEQCGHQQGSVLATRLAQFDESLLVAIARLNYMIERADCGPM